MISAMVTPSRKATAEEPRLKEKLPQVFMQIGWIEDDSRNLTA